MAEIYETSVGIAATLARDQTFRVAEGLSLRSFLAERACLTAERVNDFETAATRYL